MWTVCVPLFSALCSALSLCWTALLQTHLVCAGVPMSSSTAPDTHTAATAAPAAPAQGGRDRAGWSQLLRANTFHCTLMTASPPADVTLALTPLHGPQGIPQGQKRVGGGGHWEEEGGGVTQMREDTPGGGTALRELEVMNILTDRRGSNEFKLNYMCCASHEQARQGYFKGADIITPFREFDKKEICIRQSEIQHAAAWLVLHSEEVRRWDGSSVSSMCLYLVLSLYIHDCSPTLVSSWLYGSVLDKPQTLVMFQASDLAHMLW